MDQMQDARRVVLALTYNGHDVSADIAGSLVSFAYTDDTGMLDGLDISLEDREKKWQGPWTARAGDKIKAEIRTINWDGPGQIKSLPLGSFEVDSGSVQGSPDTVTIKAISLPNNGSAKLEKRSKAWEKTTLKTVAAEIAKRSGLTLLYEAADNPSYDRLQQTEQSDLGFLQDSAGKEGLAIKVSGAKLVLFDEFAYEQKKAIATITRGTDNVTGFSFSWSMTDAAYRACTISYTPKKSKTAVSVTYTPPGAPAAGPTLKVNEQADSQAAALRLARIRLREKNKEVGKGSLQLMGDIRMAAGLTINIKGWGSYDGKYIIVSARHTIDGGGFKTDLEIRKILGW